MNIDSPESIIGRVASLHLHAAKPGKPLTNVEVIEVVAGKGIADEPRYFGRIDRTSGQPGRRQVSLIEREQIAEHAAALGLKDIPPGTVRANIETSGIRLVPLAGQQVRIGEALLLIDQPRTPCAKMDAICQGLRVLMQDSRQGVMALVLESGRIRLNDPIRLANGTPSI